MATGKPIEQRSLRTKDVQAKCHCTRTSSSRSSHFLTGRVSGPLFYDASRGRGASDENPHHQKIGGKLAESVRRIGVDDEEVDPNHGWRHRFNYVARRLQMNPEIRDAIKGHKPRTEGEEYGGAIDYDMM